MIYLLDTNILIYLIKNQPHRIAQRVDALPEIDTLCMSFVTWTELLKGAERSTRKTEVLRRLNALARQVPVRYPADSAICRHYAEQATLLKEAGTPIGANDLWIALPRAGGGSHSGHPQYARIQADCRSARGGLGVLRRRLKEATPELPPPLSTLTPRVLTLMHKEDPSPCHTP